MLTLPVGGVRGRRRWPLVGGLTVASMLLAGCGLGEEADGGRRVHEDFEGPLTVSAGAGSISVAAPNRSSWVASFGSFTLCADDEDEQPVLEGVRVASASRAPQRVDVFLRTVAPRGEAAGVDASPGSRQAFLSTKGSPPLFEEPYAEGRYGGEFTTELEGTAITQPCDPRPNRETGYQELIFSLVVGPDGGEVRRAWVDYTLDGEPHSVAMRWRMVACGDAFGGVCPE